MLKRILPYLIVVLIAVPAVVYLLSRDNTQSEVVQNQCISLVPEDAVWILESTSVPGLLSTFIQADPLFQSLLHADPLEPGLKAIRTAATLAGEDSNIRKAFFDHPAVLSLHPTGKALHQLLLIIDLQGPGGAGKSAALIDKLGGTTGKWTDRIYNGERISRITFNENALIPGISLAETKRFLLISPSPVLVENSIRLMEQPSALTSMPAFRKLAGASGTGSPGRMYINLTSFPRWMGTWMNSKTEKGFNDFKRYGEWAALDLEVRNNALLLSGFAIAGDTLNSYLNIFKRQIPMNLGADRYLPSLTAAFFTAGVENTDDYFKDLSDYLANGATGRARQKSIGQVSGVIKENIIKSWNELGFSEITIGYLTSAADESVHPVVLVAVERRGLVADKLNKWEDLASGVKPGTGINRRKPRMTSSSGGVEIFDMPFDHLPLILGGGLFSAVTGRYYAFSGNVLILADDPAIIRDVAGYQENNKVLATDPFYLSYPDLASTRSNMIFFAVPSKSRSLIKRMLHPDLSASIESNEDLWRKTGAVCLQIHNRDGLFYHNFCARFGGLQFDTPYTIWESRLDGRIGMQPAIVLNHLTGEQEIVVQDEANTLYLLANSGRVIWKKQIGEKILSSIQQIDLMKNGKLHYLFSTGSKLHLLDRNGNPVSRFPVLLKSTATNGMALVDPDRNRDYRILIACADQRVYCYDKGGNLLKNWEFGKTEGTVSTPVQYFKLQDKDFLVFNDERKVYLVDRKGKSRVDLTQEFSIPATGRLLLDESTGNPGERFLITDREGRLFSIYPDGRVDTLILGTYGQEHHFFYEDVNQDGLKEFVFIDGNRIDFFSRSGEKIRSQRLAGECGPAAGIVELQGKHKAICISLPARGEVLLISSPGTVYPGFPLKGISEGTVAVLDQSGGYYNLLVGSTDGYLYNYAFK